MSQHSYSWSDASALYQVTHGEAGTARTDSAFRYLERALNAPADEAQTLARGILAALRTVRDSEPVAGDTPEVDAEDARIIRKYNDDEPEVWP